MEIADLIKNIRKENNLTQQQFADKIKVTKQDIITWEKGQNSPQMEIIRSVCHTFSVDSNILMQLEKELPSLISNEDDSKRIESISITENDYIKARRKYFKSFYWKYNPILWLLLLISIGLMFLPKFFALFCILCFIVTFFWKNKFNDSKNIKWFKDSFYNTDKKTINICLLLNVFFIDQGNKFAINYQGDNKIVLDYDEISDVECYINNVKTKGNIPHLVNPVKSIMFSIRLNDRTFVTTKFETSIKFKCIEPLIVSSHIENINRMYAIIKPKIKKVLKK